MVYTEVHLKGVADLVNADIAVGAAIAKSKIATALTWAVADIPSLPTSIITSGIFAGVRGGLEKELVGDFQNDYIIVYKTADGKFHMQSLGTPSAHGFLDSTAHNNTLTGTPVRGDLIVANSTPAWAKFAKGSQYTLLVMGANNPAWALIVNANIDAAAAIAYSKLALSNSLLNADINASAAIAYSKLALSNSILNADINSSAAIAYSKLALASSIMNADIANSANIAWSKLSKSGSSIADLATKDHDLLGGLGDDDHTQYLLANGTRLLAFLKLTNQTSDPTLVEGILFYRSDLDAYYVSYDGATKKQVMTEGLSQAEGVLFGNGFSDTLSPVHLTKTGNGVLTCSMLYGILTSGASLNDKTAAYVIWSPASPAMGDAVYGKTPQFELYIYIPDAANIKIWILWGGPNNVAETAVDKRFGIKIVNTALWGLAADGASLTETDLATTLAQGTWYKLRVKHTGSNITVWKDGVELATKVTANLPSGSDTAESCIQVICANTVAADKSVRFKPMKALHGS